MVAALRSELSLSLSLRREVIVKSPRSQEEVQEEEEEEEEEEEGREERGTEGRRRNRSYCLYNSREKQSLL